MGDELDTYLIKVSPDLLLTLEGFLKLLRENSVAEGPAIKFFLDISTNGQTITVETCRGSILRCVEQILGIRFVDHDRSRCTTHSVLWDANESVSMKEWLDYCRKVARVIRLAYGCGVCEIESVNE